MSNWMVYALGSALFAGLTAVLAKIGLEGVPSVFATFVRVLILVPVIGFILWVTKSLPNSPLPSKAWTFLALSALTTGLSWLFYFQALKEGPVAGVASLDKLSLVIAVLLAFIFLGERPSSWQWFGALFMVGGGILMAFK